MSLDLQILALLKEIDGINSAARTKRMVELGRMSRDDVNAKNLIGKLENGTVYEQFLAVETSFGSRDVGVLVRLLGSGSKLVTRRALNLILRLGTDEEILQTLNDIPINLKIYGIRRLRCMGPRRKRPQVIDGFLGSLNGDDRRIFKSLLPYASPQMVEKHLLDVIDRFTMIDWARLTKNHSEIAQKAIREWADRSENEDPRLFHIAYHLIERFSSSSLTVDIGLDVMRTMLKTTSLNRISDNIEPLIRKRTIEMVDIILGVEEQVELGYIHSWPWKKIPLDKLLDLWKRYPDLIFAYQFYGLTAEQRRAVYEIVKIGWRRDEDGVLDEEILKSLPRDLRIKEGRRNLKLPCFEPTPAGRISYIACLPWDEAMGLQKPFLTSSDAETRKKALKYQIGAAMFEPSHLGDALKLALKCQSEQSIVRDEMHNALNSIPGSRWKGEHLEDLGTVIRYALDASDLAKAGPYDLLKLVTVILPWHPRWGARQMSIIMKAYPGFVPRQLRLSGGVLPVKGVVEMLAEEMKGWLETFEWKDMDDMSWETRSSLMLMGEKLGAAARYWPEFLDVLEKALLDEKWLSQVGEICTILKRCRPHSWFKVATRMIDSEELKITFMSSKEILQHVHVHEQSFIPLILKDAPDNFMTKLYYIDFNGGFERWSAEQQEILAVALVSKIKDEDTSQEDKQLLMKELAVLPFVEAKHLVALASDESPVTRERATRALGHLDGDQSLPVLVEALSDDRARFAIYSLRRSFKSLSPTETLKILRGVSMTKVTVAKEAVRLIGDLGTEEALQYLSELDKTDLHIDVRVALFRALWSYLESDEAWAIFTQAAQSTDSVIAKAVATIPNDGLSSHARGSLLDILLLLIQHPVAEVRLIALKRLDDIPLQDTENILTTRLFELLQSPFEKEAAAAATAAFKTYSGMQPELVADAFKQALDNRKRLSTLYDEYFDICDPNDNKSMIPATLRILSVLKTNRLAVTFRLKLMFQGLPWTKLQPQILDIIPELHADALVCAEELIAEADNQCTEIRTKEFQKVLAASEDQKARRLGLEFLRRGVDEDRGWSDEQREALLRYRESESVLVAEAAWNVYLPDRAEEEDE